MKKIYNRLLNNEIIAKSIYAFIVVSLATITIAICSSMLYGTYKYILWLFS